MGILGRERISSVVADTCMRDQPSGADQPGDSDGDTRGAFDKHISPTTDAGALLMLRQMTLSLGRTAAGYTTCSQMQLPKPRSWVLLQNYLRQPGATKESNKEKHVYNLRA